MGAEIIIWCTFGAYLVLLLGIGWWGDRRFGKSYEGFVTADKSLGGWVAAISAAASSESAWVMLGLSGLGYSKGIAGYWAALGCTLGFAVTSLFVVVQLRRSSDGMQILTLGDYFERVLGDKRQIVRVVSALVIAVFMQVYVVAQFMGTGKQMDGMKLISYDHGVIAGAIIIGIYVLIGGYAAVCWTDMIQGILMALVMIAFPLVAISKAGGLGPVAQALEQHQIDVVWIGREGITWAAAGFALGQLGIGVGYPGMPHSIIRFITVRDEKQAKNAAIIGLVWGALVLFGAVTLGIAGRALMPGLEDPEHVLPAFTAAHFHPVVSGLILAAVSAAIMSTADSQLMMAATAVIHDVWTKKLRHVLPERLTAPALTIEANMAMVLLAWGMSLIETETRHSLYAFPVWYLLLFVVWYLLMRRYENTERSRVIQVRAFIGLLALVAMRIALIKPRVIYTFVLFAWGALGASFTPTILLSLHWKRFNWKGGLACFIAGPLTIMLWKVIPGLSEALYEMIPGVVVSTVAGVAVSIATSKEPPEEQTA